MTARPAAALAALTLAAAALLTACGPSQSHPAGGTADSAQVQDMQQKLDSADDAAAQADTDAAADNG
ncbi:hypothetical protein ACFVHB_34425 [Kitasatospora sp. NPDC127111]|uniref:hypothetical protein n=1 Tax=Kitasatospora sp. NPDC127111 TaxID=3345363 RepID=UPI003629C791